MRIGTFSTPCRVLLAPIAGYTDLAFRMAARAAGHRGLAYTELLNPRGILRQTPASVDIAATDEGDEPLGVQLYGNEIEWLCEAAKWAEGHGAQVIDINMGCPVDKVTKTNGGSMLLCDPDRTTGMASRIVKSVGVPVTAKVRMGWNKEQITAPRLARQLEEVGVSLITVHARVAEQFFKPPVNWQGIGEVVASVKEIPIIGNGDIQRPEDAKRMVDETGCAGVMVARAAIKRPWLLRQIDDFLETGRAAVEPTVVEKVRILRTHFAGMVQYRDERYAVTTMRQRIAQYGASLGHIKPIRERVRLMRSAAEFVDIMDELTGRIDPEWREVPRGTFASDGEGPAVEAIEAAAG